VGLSKVGIKGPPPELGPLDSLGGVGDTRESDILFDKIRWGFGGYSGLISIIKEKVLRFGTWCCTDSCP